MPARKSIHQHKLQGTYKPCRHEQRTQQIQANSGTFAKCPSQLSDEAKKVWRRMVKSLPNVTELDAPILAQFSLLYSRLLSDTEHFTSAEHNQLRLLVKELKQIEAIPEDKPLDAFELFQQRNEEIHRQDREARSLKALKAKHPSIK